MGMRTRACFSGGNGLSNQVINNVSVRSKGWRNGGRKRGKSGGRDRGREKLHDSSLRSEIEIHVA